MNGEERHFFEIELTKLKTQFDERWRSHDKGANDRAKDYCRKFEGIFNKLDEIVKTLAKKPCLVNQEKISNLEKESTNRFKLKLTLIGAVITVFITVATSLLGFRGAFGAMKEKTETHTKEIIEINKEINSLHPKQ